MNKTTSRSRKTRSCRCLAACLALATAGGLTTVFADQTLQLDFENGLDGVGPKGEAIRCVTPGILTLTDQGKNGRAALVANRSLDAFQSLTDGSPPIETGHLKFELGSVLNRNQGSISMWVRPFFNGEYTGVPAGEQCHYYLFDSGQPDPANTQERSGGIRILLIHTRTPEGQVTVLSALLALDTGETVQLEAAVSWDPEAWHQIGLSWDPVKATLFFDKYPVASQPTGSSLEEFQEFFTIGGTWYGTHPLQGLVDEVAISDEPGTPH